MKVFALTSALLTPLPTGETLWKLGSPLTDARFARKDLERVFEDMNLRYAQRKTGSVAVSVRHLPALGLHSMMEGNLFLSSGAHDLFPAPTRCIDPESMVLFSDNLPEHWREKVALNAGSLVALLSAAGVAPGKAHFWGLGSSAKYLAHVVSSTNYTPLSSNSGITEASVIVLDRTMDLVAPTAHSDHLIHRMLALLPSREPPSSDVHVNMESVFPKAIKSPQLSTERTIPTGRLLDRQCQSTFSSMVPLKHKDSLNTLRKKMVDVITEEEIQVNVAAMVRDAHSHEPS